MRFVLVLLLLAGCGGSNDPVTIRGANLFYLATPQQDMPYLLRTIDEPATRADLDRILSGLQAVHVNTIRLLIAADHFPLTGTPNTWPVPAAWQTEGLGKLVDIIAAKQMQVYLIFVGKTVDEKNAVFVSAEKDIEWIEAFLRAVSREVVIRVDLSGDVFLCDPDGCEVNPYQRGHADYIRALWSMRPRDWPVSYEVAGPHEHTNADGVRHTMNWVIQNTPEAPLSMGFYGKAGDVREFVKVIRSFGRPIWVSEYGGSEEFYREFLSTALCEERWPVFAWTAGVGWYGYGLWHPTLDTPTPQLNVMSEHYGRCN